MNSTPKYRSGANFVLHSAVTTLPVPTANAGNVIFRRPGNFQDPAKTSVVLLADIVFTPAGGLTSLTGPVYLWARVPVTSLLDQWQKVELIELTAVDLSEGAVSYRLQLSPFWQRAAIAAPSWTPGVGQNVTIRFQGYNA